jgi:hypothetical protein
MPRKIFGPKTNEVSAQFILHNEELCDTHRLPHFLRTVKSRRHKSAGGYKECVQNFNGKIPWGNIQLGDHEGEDNNNMYLG